MELVPICSKLSSIFPVKASIAVNIPVREVIPIAIMIIVRMDLSLLLIIDFKATLTFSLNNGENLKSTDIFLLKRNVKIGNYLLLNESINKKIKNKYIDEKIDEYNRIIPHDITLKTPMNTVDFNKFEIEKEKYIFARQKNIAEMIYNDFPLAKVIILK